MKREYLVGSKRSFKQRFEERGEKYNFKRLQLFEDTRMMKPELWGGWVTRRHGSHGGMLAAGGGEGVGK